MRSRRRRGPRVVWLPPDPYNRLGSGQGAPITTADTTNIGEWTLTTPQGGAGNYTGAVIPLLGDRPGTENLIIGVNASAGTPSTFSDLFNSGYRLRRICGHLFCYTIQAERAGDPQSAYNWFVTAGLQVMEADRGTASDGTEGATDIYQTSENPWIWRRSWILTNFDGALAAGKQTIGVISNVQGAASLREGSFIDQKTIRKVGPDHRLFLCVQATNIDSTDLNVETNDIHFFWNLRALGSLMTNLGNRGNSSR